MASVHMLKSWNMTTPWGHINLSKQKLGLGKENTQEKKVELQCLPTFFLTLSNQSGPGPVAATYP